MPRSAAQLRTDAFAIWQAGVEAVRSDRLVREQVVVDDGELHVDGETFHLGDIDRILVVGGGKAGAGMAAGLEQALGPRLLKEKQVTGWLNVPADCVRELQTIHLHAARPAGVNEPTAEGVAGTEEILKRVQGMGPRDLCICLISGGGSALMPSPVPQISLEQKLLVTRLLSSVGADIRELNTVRKHLSRFKGGGLAAAMNQGKMVTLIISDVLGDPLDLIASGPTVPDYSIPGEATAVLERHGIASNCDLQPVVEYLKSRTASLAAARKRQAARQNRVPNSVIGSNAVAVDAAGIEAERRGYSHAMNSANKPEEGAGSIGSHHAHLAKSMRTESGPDCLITGGEPVVALAPADIRGRGGRNQQLVLEAIDTIGLENFGGIVLLSGGTDGEDGPTDAAGAFVDEAIARQAIEQNLDVKDSLLRNDAYTFFDRCGGLIRTGPTHTNVCDLRVICVDRIESPGR